MFVLGSVTVGKLEKILSPSKQAVDYAKLHRDGKTFEDQQAIAQIAKQARAAEKTAKGML